MTRLVLIHGINNEDNTPEEILDTWIDSIRAAAGKDSAWATRVSKASVAPYYGKSLAEMTKTKKPKADPQGASYEPEDFEQAADDAIAAIAAGVSPQEIVAAWEDPTGAIEQGAGIHKKWLKAAARVIEHMSPRHGRLALRVLKQAHVYLTRPHVAAAVDDLVRPGLDADDQMVIVSHSLGTIVSYKLLREFARKRAPRKSPLYVTLGSPLGIDVVRRTFTTPRNRPADVSRWVNGADPEDFVALHKELTTENFGPGVNLNISDIKNGYADKHSITDYLSDKRVADEIAVHFP